MDKLQPHRGIKFRNLILAFFAFISVLIYPHLTLGQPTNSSSDSVACEELRRTCDYNFNHFLLDELSRHRLVLLGDAGHGSSVYLQGVISFLNSWIDSLESVPIHSDQSMTKLFLILESSSDDIARLRSYFASGDLSQMITPAYLFSPQFTTASLEFYYDLRQIFKRIEVASAQKGNQPRLVLDLFGPEKVIDINNWSFAKRDSFFIFERDQYSSKKIYDLLTQNPDWKALAFYGDAHLARSKVIKSAGRTSAQGAYLAHFLDSLFDSTGALFTVYQWTGPREQMAYLSGAPDSSYALDVRQLKDPTIGHFDQTDADGVIVRYGHAPEERSVMDVRSEKLVQLILDSSSNWQNLRNDFYRAQAFASMRYFTMTYGAVIDTLMPRNIGAFTKSWKPWIDSVSRGDLNVVSDLESEAPTRRLIDHMSNSYGRWTNWYESYIAHAIGRTPFFDTTKTSAHRAQTYREILNKDRTKILIDNLVNLLWVGTDTERANAVSLLNKMTGKTCATPKEWMIWYRNEFRSDLIDLYQKP